MENNDSHPPGTATTEDLIRCSQQLELDLPPPAEKTTAPDDAEPGPAAAHTSATPVGASSTLKLVPPAKVVKPAKKRGGKATGKPHLTAVPSPSPDPAEQIPTSPDTQVHAAAPDGGQVISLKSERIARDPRIREMLEFIDQSYSLAKERLKYAQAGGDSVQEEDAYVRQWGLAVATHSRTLTTLHKHIEFLERDD